MISRCSVHPPWLPATRAVPAAYFLRFQNSKPHAEDRPLLQLLYPIAALLSGCALLLLGNGLLNTVLVLRGSIEAFSDQILGLAMSAYFVGFLIGTHVAVTLIKRMGHIRAFAFCAALFACCVLAYVMWINIWAWMLLRVVTGLALAVLYTVMEAWLNGQTAARNRGQVFAIYMMVNLGALAMAQQFIRLDSPAAFTLFGLSAIFAAAAVMPMTWTRMTPPMIHDTPRLHPPALFRAAPIAIVGAVLSGLCMGAFWGLAPLFINNLGLDAGVVAVFMTTAIFGGALLQLPLGRFSDRHDRRKVMFWVTMATTVTGFLIVYAVMPGNELLWLLYAAGGLFGGFAFAVQPIAVAHLIDHLQDKDVLSGSSGLLQMHGVGSAIGPALAGVAMGLAGNLALPVFFIAVNGLLGVYVVYAVIRSRRMDESAQQHAHFVPIEHTGEQIMRLHPDLPPEAAPRVPRRRETD